MDTCQKDDERVKKLPPRQAALKALVDSGVPIHEAAKQLRYTYGSARQLLYKNGLTKFKFADDRKAQKIANKTITSLAAGKIPDGSGIKIVKDSTALDAAKYIHTYLEPVKSEAPAGPSISFTQVNINWGFVNQDEQQETVEASPIIDISLPTE